MKYKQVYKTIYRETCIKHKNFLQVINPEKKYKIIKRTWIVKGWSNILNKMVKSKDFIFYLYELNN